MSTESRAGRAKYRDIAERLLREFQDSGYRDGDTIPTIRVLAERFGVNPQTVNKATAYLASRGHLQSRQGSGIVFRKPEESGALRRIVMLADVDRAKLLSDDQTPTNYHCKDIYLGFLAEAQARNVRTNFVVYRNGAVSDEMKAEISQADGFVVQGDLPRPYVEALTSSGIPTVYVNRALPADSSGTFGAILVSTDHVRDLSTYLLSLGHRRILYALYARFEQGEVYRDRLRVLHRSIADWQASGAADAEPEVREFVFDSQDRSADRALKEAMAEGFTAAFGYNDFSALELYRVARRAGAEVPGDLSVVGFDGMMMGEYATPPLTTVRVNRVQLVREAISLLSRLISGSVAPEERVIVMETELVLRSSAIPPKNRSL